VYKLQAQVPLVALYVALFDVHNAQVPFMLTELLAALQIQKAVELLIVKV